MRRVSVLLALGGLCLLTLIVASHGIGRVARAALSVGEAGFCLAVAIQFALFGLLALAWHSACPDLPWRDLLLGRTVRESATSVLPFSQVGGLAFGMQATAARGVGLSRSFAANVVDITLESTAQIAFIALGIVCLLVRAPDSRLAVPLGFGLPLMAAAIGALLWLQQGGRARLRPLFRGFARRLARQWQGAALDGIARVGAELDRLYAAPGRLGLASAIHLVAWIGGAGWTFVTFRLLGVPVTPVEAIAIEGVVSGILTVSFLVPGNLGVQEAAYVALASAFGIGADPALALSLVRRAKDLAIGIPLLLLWQFVSLRRWRASSPVLEGH